MLKLNQLKSLVKTRLEKGFNVMLVSYPGIGKSEFCEQIANDNGWDCYIYHTTMGTPVHLMGVPYGKDDDYAHFKALEFMKLCYTAEKKTLVVLEEVGNATPIMQSCIAQLIQSRTINGKRISDNIMFVGCTNDIKDGAGVGKIIEPLKSRMSIFDFYIEVNEWIQWFESKNVHPIFSLYFKKYPEQADAFVVVPNCENTCNRRNWYRTMMVFDESTCCLESIKADVGMTAALNFMAFFQVYKKMIPIYNEVMKDWKNAPLEKDGVHLYGLCSAMLNNLNKNNYKIIGNYILRYIKSNVNKEITGFMAEAMAKRNNEYKNSIEYTELVALINI